ncbi:hypothetical protein, partial [Rhizobium sp. UBA1881]|uniref:hypothetical protein n=1 Tax=Rhizobium sp. UBA1881 TaxID=1947375 RepID=UPI0025FB9C1D
PDGLLQISRIGAERAAFRRSWFASAHALEIAPFRLLSLRQLTKRRTRKASISYLQAFHLRLPDMQ